MSVLFLVVARTAVVALAQGHQIQLQGGEHVEKNCTLFPRVLTSTTLTFKLHLITRWNEGAAYRHRLMDMKSVHVPEKHIWIYFQTAENTVLPVSPTCLGSKWLTTSTSSTNP